MGAAVTKSIFTLLEKWKRKKKSGFAELIQSQAMGVSWLEPTRRLRRLSDESRGSKNMSEPHRRSLPGRHFTALLWLLPSHLPLKKKKTNPCTALMCMHTHVTRGWIHCGDTRERHLHFQLNCWPSLQNATLDCAPSPPARLLLLRQPRGARWKRLLHHAHEKHGSQQNYWSIFFFIIHLIMIILICVFRSSFPTHGNCSRASFCDRNLPQRLRLSPGRCFGSWPAHRTVAATHVPNDRSGCHTIDPVL